MNITKIVYRTTCVIRIGFDRTPKPPPEIFSSGSTSIGRSVESWYRARSNRVRVKNGRRSNSAQLGFFSFYLVFKFSFLQSQKCTERKNPFSTAPIVKTVVGPKSVSGKGNECYKNINFFRTFVGPFDPRVVRPSPVFGSSSVGVNFPCKKTF